MIAPESALARTLDVAAEAAGDLRQPWWIIGSAAAALAGLAEEVADVDLLTGEADASRLLARWEAETERPSPSSLFASAIFGTHFAAALPIEVMAGLKIRGELLSPRTRTLIPWRDRPLYIPAVPEQIEILRRFGREKDLRRAERLQALVDSQRGSL